MTCVHAMPALRLSTCTFANPATRWSKWMQESADVHQPAEIDRLCEDALDAAKFLRETIVQAKLNERGNYGASMCICVRQCASVALVMHADTL